MLTLKKINKVPNGFLNLKSPQKLYTILPEPTLLHLQGRRKAPLFISILLHGNEDTGFYAVQKLLQYYQHRQLPRSLIIFFGNIEAAKRNQRHLIDQPDYNRVWPGTNDTFSEEARLAYEVTEIVANASPFASVDIHNNTGRNPHYGCINVLEPQFLQLARLFSRTVIFFETPRGIQSMAMSKYCPSITIECGKTHQSYGINHAFEFLNAVLHLTEISTNPVHHQDIDLFQSIARVKIPEEFSFGFKKKKNVDIRFQADLDCFNFSELSVGTKFAKLRQNSQANVIALDDEEQDIASLFFSTDNNYLTLTHPVMPAMLTLNKKIIRQDCLCYLMQRLEIPSLGIITQ